MKEIMPHTKGRIKNIIKKIKHHLEPFILIGFCFVSKFQKLFSIQKLIHILSPQYGHCITLLSIALLHFGQSL